MKRFDSIFRRCCYSLNIYHVASLILYNYFYLATVAFKPFDDTSIFKIDWPGRTGKGADDILAKYAKDALLPDEAVVVSSSDEELYVCKLPQDPKDTKGHIVEYFGPTPKQLIKTLYDQRSCIYRIDVYWTYEFCHGQYLLQYHEEKDARRVNRQEYYLGQYIPELDESDDPKIDYISKPPKRKIDDQVLPYYAVEYGSGTHCDVTGQPRRTTVYYVCNPDITTQIHTFDEISSCEYELVIVTPKLCTHPGFKREKIKEHKIECFPTDRDTPTQPLSYLLLEKERKWNERYSFDANNYHDTASALKATLDTLLKREIGLIKPSVPKNIDFSSSSSTVDQSDSEDDDDSSSVFESSGQSDSSASGKTSRSAVGNYRKTVAPPPSFTDQSLTRAFLSGEQCLYGGEGWWRYEYCHLKHVVQYHDLDEHDPSYQHSTPKTIKVELGHWDPQAHSDWIRIRPHKKPFASSFSQSSSTSSSSPYKIAQVSHFYSNGDYCEETGRRRTVEVRLKCKPVEKGGTVAAASSPNAVSIYLLEPKTCEYVLGVETPMLCDALQTADENGILKKHVVAEKDEL